MHKPTGDKYAEVLGAFRSLDGNPAMDKVLEWIKQERDTRDKENRVVATANKTTEAHALTVILEMRESAQANGLGRL